MCGIAGVVEEHGTDADVLRRVEAMVAGIDHRGPDAHNTRDLASPMGRRGVIGAVRLRIIDLAPEADQPLADDRGEIWTAFNGELYNFKELRAELSALGYRFRTASDTECLVHLYRHCDGDMARMLGRLRGMFAFAIWDTARGRLCLARDRLGIKPLHWVATANGVAFCSEQRPLARGGFAPDGFDRGAIAGFLAKGVVPTGPSIFPSINRLGPGEFLSWEGGAPHVERWWRPVLSYRGDLLDPDRAQREVTAAITSSVERHLVADRTVGVFLSSGTDSTSVATIAARHGAQHSLTVRFPDEMELDEGEASAATAARLGLDHQEVAVTGKDALAALPDFLRSIDSPTGDAFNSWLICRAAHEAGIVVALSGLGGDELFAGYRTFRLVPTLRRALYALDRLPRGLRNATAKRLANIGPLQLVTRSLLARSGSSGAYHAMRQVINDAELRGIGLTPPDLFTLETDPGGVDAVTLLELGSYLRDQLLPDIDSVSMAHSLEVRVPLLDDVVVRTALALPEHIRAEGKQMIAVAGGLGPQPPKRTFTLPLAEWMQCDLRDTVRDALLDDRLPFGDVLPAPFRAQLWDNFTSGRDHWFRAWSVAVLRLWPQPNGFDW
jgi:asparagine synthase (glutamine-hydrolysing)